MSSKVMTWPFGAGATLTASVSSSPALLYWTIPLLAPLRSKVGDLRRDFGELEPIGAGPARSSSSCCADVFISTTWPCRSTETIPR
jgi:hypothetical protein